MDILTVVHFAAALGGLFLMFYYMIPKLVNMRGKTGHIFAIGASQSSFHSGDFLAVIIFYGCWWFLGSIISGMLAPIFVLVLSFIPVVGVILGYGIAVLLSVTISAAIGLFVVGMIRS